MDSARNGERLVQIFVDADACPVVDIVENIDLMLMERHLNKKARRSSHKNHMKGCTMSSGHRFCTDRSGNGDPRKRTEDDDVRFAQSFEKLILMAKSKEGAQSGTI